MLLPQLSWGGALDVLVCGQLNPWSRPPCLPLPRSGRDPDDISSIVLVEREASYIKSEAILRIGSGLGAPLPLVAGALNAGFPLSFKNGVCVWGACVCEGSGLGRQRLCCTGERGSADGLVPQPSGEHLSLRMFPIPSPHNQASTT